MPAAPDLDDPKALASYLGGALRGLAMMATQAESLAARENALRTLHEVWHVLTRLTPPPLDKGARLRVIAEVLHEASTTARATNVLLTKYPRGYRSPDMRLKYPSLYGPKPESKMTRAETSELQATRQASMLTLARTLFRMRGLYPSDEALGSVVATWSARHGKDAALHALAQELKCADRTAKSTGVQIRRARKKNDKS
jgi:hypothetical protein